MSSTAIGVDPDDLAAIVDPEGKGGNGAAERDINRHQFSRANGSSASSTAPFIIRLAPPPSPETRTGRTGALSQTHASRTSSLAPAVGALPGRSTGPLRDRVNARAANA
jgi:hypothetical protein